MSIHSVFPDVSPNSSGNRFRRRRIGLLNQMIADVLATRERCTILDIGGTEIFWQTWAEFIDWRRVDVTCVNLPDGDRGPPARIGRVRMTDGDARDLSSIQSGAYDICFSNSVIEHVGLWSDMAAMAQEIRRIAPRYLVQTPNFWFPVEPHSRAPLLHWLPEPMAYRVLMARRCGFWARAQTVDAAVRAVQSARLIDARQMAALFEGAVILRERFLGVTKSLIALRS